MKTNVLIKLLAGREIRSGTALAAELGVSRTAVWKQVKRAIEQGHQIETVRGKGYRLVGTIDFLDRADILTSLPRNVRRRVSLQVLDSVDSTNAEVSRRFAADEATVLVSLADAQTAGRGRRGRDWQSPRGENLYLSLGLSLPGGFSALDGFSLVVGVAAVETLSALGVRNLSLKWPNDILHHGHKLGGILIELQGELEGVARIVAGVGLNVHMTDAPGVDQDWTSLGLIEPATSWQRNRVASLLVASIISAFDEFSIHGFPAFRQRWQRWDAFAGKALKTTQGDYQGVGRGIDEVGNYQVETSNGIECVRAGEISFRVMP